MQGYKINVKWIFRTGGTTADEQNKGGFVLNAVLGFFKNQYLCFY